MKKLFFFPFVLLVVLTVWAWKSLKELFDPVTVDRSVGFYLSDPKYLVSRV